MSATVKRALELWGLNGAECALIAARENAVYKVSDGDRNYALRLHRKGYRNDRELWSELVWMEAAERAGIRVPSPIPSSDGRMLHLVDEVQVDVLTWLPGESASEAMERAAPDERIAIFRMIGGEMARLHDASDAWRIPKGFQRRAWDLEGLLGDAPLWDRFWRNPALREEDRILLEEFRRAASAELGKRQADLDYGLIHADMVGANMMIDDGRLHLIDFDDGGFGFRLLEVATALVKHADAPDYPALRAALTEAYQSVRPIDLDLLDLFLAIRAATYVGWNITRMAEDGAAERNERFVRQARRLAAECLSSISAIPCAKRRA